MKRIFTLAALFVIIFQMAANTAKAQNIYLDFSGVKGSSTGWANSPANLIEVSSAGVTAACTTCTAVGTTGTAGKVTPGKFVFNLKDDRALEDLRKLLYVGNTVSGAGGAQVCFVFRKSNATGTATSYYYISLGEVRLIEIDEAFTASNPAAYQVSLAYGQIQYTFKPQNTDGTFGSPVTTGWDYVKNVVLTSLPIPSGL